MSFSRVFGSEKSVDGRHGVDEKKELGLEGQELQLFMFLRLRGRNASVTAGLDLNGFNSLLCIHHVEYFIVTFYASDAETSSNSICHRSTSANFSAAARSSSLM